VSDGYSVVMDDVLSMAQAFKKESGVLSGAVSAAGVSAPDGGDGVVNSALSGALKAAGMATGQLAAVIGSHGDKLNTAYQKYLTAEQSSAQLCQELTTLVAGSGG
jgi:Family of unknown function (DUF6317)